MVIFIILSLSPPAVHYTHTYTYNTHTHNNRNTYTYNTQQHIHINGYTNRYDSVATLQDASHLLAPLLKSTLAPMLFGIALLASGQNSTLTGTLSGQIVMEGFMTMKLSPTFRRVFTRLLAIIPSVVVVLIGGEHSANSLLILSQVVLSFALPFAMLPLVHLSSSEKFMGPHVNSRLTTALAVFVSIVIMVLNVVLLMPQQ